MDRKNQFYSHQTTIDILHRIRENYFKFHMTSKKTPYIQDNPKKNKDSVMPPVYRLQTILQGYSNKNNMVLVPKLTYRPK